MIWSSACRIAFPPRSRCVSSSNRLTQEVTAELRRPRRTISRLWNELIQAVTGRAASRLGYLVAT
jgi:hypothetical protein